MKAYNLKSITKNIAGKEQPVIQLGEEGRGRKSVLIKCEAGIVDGELVNLKTPKPGLPGVPQIAKSSEDPCDEKWLARISTNGAYIRGAQGNIRYLSNTPPATLISKGHGAFGDAGRTGTWDDVLVVVAVGAVLRVKPSRGEAYFLKFDSEQVIKMTAQEAQFEGISTEIDNYVSFG